MAKVDARVIKAGAGDRAIASDANGTEHTILVNAVASARELKGPSGATLVITDLIVGTAVTLDIRKSKVERILAVAFPDGAAEAAKEAGAEAREQAREAERQRREREEAERARREAEAIHTRGDFNPYTFLPFRSHRPDPGSRPRHRTAPSEAVVAARGGERAALHSGRVRLRLELASPLATYGAETREDATHRARPPKGKEDMVFEPLRKVERAGHVVVSLLRDSGGRPTIAGSSLKGAMRSWFEFITSGHRDISPAGVAWREPAVDDDARVCGVLLLHRRDSDGRHVRLDRLRAEPDGRLDRDVVAHILPLNFRGFKEQDEPVEPGPRSRHRVGLMWRAWEPASAGTGGRSDLENGTPLLRRTAGGPDVHGILQVGVGVTDDAVGVRVAELPSGVTSSSLADIDPTTRTDLIAVPREALEVWYEAHRGGGGPGGSPVEVDVEGAAGSGRSTLRFTRPDARALQHARPVFYRREGERITYLSVIRGGRNAVTRIPAERHHPGLPAHDDDRLDAARRIFGRVPGESQKGADGDGAWAGRVRVGAVHYEGGARTERFTLRPLMSPKVQAAGFYLTDHDRVSWAPGKAGKLAGTKVYWHQIPVTVPGDSSPLAARVRATAVAADRDGAVARTTTNSTVEALVEGSFRVDVWFEDLDEHELGALLLAVSLRFRDGDAVGWRIGLAKPLGFGSVVNVVEAVEIVDDHGPSALALRPLDPEDIDRRIDTARRYWFGESRTDLDVAAGIAALGSVRAEAFGYPRLGATRFDVEAKAYPRQDSAQEVLAGGSGRPVSGRADQRRGRPGGGRR